MSRVAAGVFATLLPAGALPAGQPASSESSLILTATVQ